MKEVSLFLFAALIVMLGAAAQAVGTMLDLGWVRALAGGFYILALITANESGRRHNR